MNPVDQLKNSIITQLLLPLIAGISFAFVFHDHRLITTMLIIIILLFCVLLATNTKKIAGNYTIARVWGITVAFFFIILGYTITIFRYNQPNYTTIHTPHMAVCALIKDIPSEKKNTLKIVAEIKAIKPENEWQTTRGKALLYISKDNSGKKLQTGDRIILSPVFKELAFENNPHQFNYRQYYYYKHIYRTAYIKNNEWIFADSSSRKSISAIATNLRQKLTGRLHTLGMHGDEYAVTGAMLLGSRDEISDDIYREFAITGAMHILSVSGLHTGIVCLILQFLFGFLTKRKYGQWIYAVTLLLLLWFYALITGMSAAVLRATAMFSFIIIGNSLARPVNIFNSISASLLILLIYDPFLIMDIGLQFSYLAVIAIVLLYPWLYSLLSGPKWLMYLWSMVCVSVAAQAGITPILILKMHTFSTWFLITNIIVIPLSGLMIYAGMTTLILSPLTAIASLTGKLTQFIATVLLQSVQMISHLPFASTNQLFCSVTQTILLYVAIGFLIIFFIVRRQYGIHGFLVCLILFVAFSLDREWKVLHHRKFTVYNSRNSSCYSFMAGHKAYLFTDSAGYPNARWLNEDLIHSGIKAIQTIDAAKYCTIETADCMLSLTHQHLKLNNSESTLIVPSAAATNLNLSASDILILSEKNKHLKPEDILQFKPSCIVLDASCSRSFRKRWKDTCLRRGIRLHDIQEQGSYTWRL